MEKESSILFLNLGHVYIDNYLRNSSGLVRAHSNYHSPGNLHMHFLKHVEHASSAQFLTSFVKRAQEQ